MTSIGKATDVLDVLAAQARPQGLSEVTRGTGLAKATTRRLLVGLIEQGLVLQHDDGRYDLGNGLMDIAARSLAEVDVAVVGRSRLDELRRHVVGTVVLSVFDDHVLTPVARSDPASVQYFASSDTAGAHHATAAGKAVLAVLPAVDVDRLVPDEPIRFTAKTVASRAALLEELVTVRARGFALEDEEAQVGVRALACVIRTYAGRPAATLGVVTPAPLVAMGELVRSAGVIAAAADDISAALGGPPVSATQAAS